VRKLGVNTNRMEYEGETIALPGGSEYTPDYSDGHTRIECKGAYRLQSHGRSVTAFHAARELKGGVWILATRKTGKRGPHLRLEVWGL